MATEQNIMEEQNNDEEQNLTEEQYTDEEKIAEDLSRITVSEPEHPIQPIHLSQDNGQAKSTREDQNWPMHERCVHGEINDISIPLDKSEVYFRIAESYELLPFSRYHYRECLEVEHLFMPAKEFAEEIFSDWSPCPSSTAMGI